MASLRWVVHYGVANKSSGDVIKNAFGIPLNKNDAVYREWPGLRVHLDNGEEPDDPDNPDVNRMYFDAIVGSPNGWGVALMLQQRQEHFQRHVINQAYMFGSDSGKSSCVAWRIGPVDEED